MGRALAPLLTSVSVYDAGAYALATGLVLLIATTAILVPSVSAAVKDRIAVPG